MLHISRIKYTFFYVLLSMTLSSCFHEDEKEDFDWPINNTDFMNIVKKEDLVPLYKSDVSNISLSSSENCDLIKEKIILAWEKELTLEFDENCPECRNHNPNHIYYQEFMETKSLILDENTIFFVTGKSLYSIELDSTGELTKTSSLEFDYSPLSIFLNKADKELIVMGLFNDSNENSAKTAISNVNISDLEDLKVIERYDFLHYDITPIGFNDGKLTLAMHSTITLPDNLFKDKSFRELVINYRDSKRLKELYDYAIENAESPPQELLDFQQTTDALVAVYKSLYDAKFDDSVKNIADLISTYQRTKNETTEETSTLSCGNIYSDPDNINENTTITQILKLDFSDPSKSASFAIFGSSIPISYQDNQILLLSNSAKKNAFENTTSTLVSFKESETNYSFESSIKLIGNIERRTLKVIADKIYLLTIQDVEYQDDNYYGELGIVNFIILKSDENGLSKLNEESVITTSWGNSLEGDVVFMKKGLYLFSSARRKEIIINYSSPEDLSISSNDIVYNVSSFIPLNESQLLIKIENFNAQYSRELRLIDITQGFEKITNLDLGEKYSYFSSGAKFFKKKNGYLIGVNINGDYINENTFRSYINLISINEDNKLVNLGKIMHEVPTSDIFCFNNWSINCSYLSNRGDAMLSNILNISDEEFMVSFLGKNIKISQLSNLSNTKEIVLGN